MSAAEMVAGPGGVEVEVTDSGFSKWLWSSDVLLPWQREGEPGQQLSLAGLTPLHLLPERACSALPPS